MNYGDLVFSIAIIIMSLTMFYASITEIHNWKLAICFLLVFSVSLDHGVDEFIEAYNKINPPCELTQGCVKKVSI